MIYFTTLGDSMLSNSDSKQANSDVFRFAFAKNNSNKWIQLLHNQSSHNPVEATSSNSKLHLYGSEVHFYWLGVDKDQVRQTSLMTPSRCCEKLAEGV